MALVGYARVSTRDQHPQAQTDALTAAGCTKVFTDQASCSLAKRPALEQAVDYLRPGDTLVISKLDGWSQDGPRVPEVYAQGLPTGVASFRDGAAGRAGLGQHPPAAAATGGGERAGSSARLESAV